jgi:hypothetical protein
VITPQERARCSASWTCGCRRCPAHAASEAQLVGEDRRAIVVDPLPPLGTLVPSADEALDEALARIPSHAAVAKLRAQLETLRKHVEDELVFEVTDVHEVGGEWVEVPEGWSCFGCDIASNDELVAYATRDAVTHVEGCPLFGVEPMKEEAGR